MLGNPDSISAVQVLFLSASGLLTVFLCLGLLILAILLLGKVMVAVQSKNDKAAPAPAAAPAAGGANNVTAPMPGNILDIAVTVGQAVTAGQTVLTMEAMKMENEIVAPAAGTVKEICVKKGDVVDTDAVLVVLG